MSEERQEHPEEYRTPDKLDEQHLQDPVPWNGEAREQGRVLGAQLQLFDVADLSRPARLDAVQLGAGSSPHGVIADASGNAWITDQGLDAIVRVDRETEAVTVYRVPAPDSNPNTAAFDHKGVLWFTGAGGFYGRVDPATGRVEAWPAAGGGGVGTSSGPYGITVTPDGVVWFVSLSGGYLGRVDPATGALTVVEPPTRNSGTRRVWSDSRGRLWVTESFASKIAMYSPRADARPASSAPALKPLRSVRCRYLMSTPPAALRRTACSATFRVSSIESSSTWISSSSVG